MEIEFENNSSFEIKNKNNENYDIEFKNTSMNTSNYNDLLNKPKINNIELIGNKKSSELNLQEEMEEITNLEIDKMFKGGVI